MKNNFHTHTCRCKHAGGSERDYLNYAINLNVPIIGFSDHAPYPDDRFGLRMDFSELKDYLDEINLLKVEQEQKKEIIVMSGLEIEYDPREDEYYNELLNEYKFDYLLLGQHFYILPDGTAQNVYGLTSTQQYIEYAISLRDAMKSGFFKVIAHPDLIFLNDMPWDENCVKACEIIAEGAQKYDCILEFNANGFRRGKTLFCDGERYQYPHKKFWDIVSTKNIRTIIGSDCHSPEQIFDDKVVLADKITKEWNLQVIDNIFE